MEGKDYTKGWDRFNLPLYTLIKYKQKPKFWDNVNTKLLLKILTLRKNGND